MEECQDCIQEIYLNLYEKVRLFDSTKGEFLPWFKKIAKNVCINLYNKKKAREKKVDYFESTSDTEGSENSIIIPYEKIEFNPEARIDQEETTRLLQEILSEIPESQQQCLLMYYVSEFKQEAIAEALGIPKGTVKSRLHNGKKLVEQKVLELEKRGTKLYGMSPIVFFAWLFAKESELQAMDASVAGISVLHANNSAKQKAIEETGIKAVAAGAKTAGIKAAVIKGVAVAAGVAVIATGGYQAAKYFHEKESEPVQNEIQGEQEEKKEQKDKTKPSLVKKIDVDFVRKILLMLPEYTEIKQKDVSYVVNMIAKKQYSYLSKGYWDENQYYIPEKYVIGIDMTELSNEYPVDILYKKEAFQDVFDLLGMELDWGQEKPYEVSYHDADSVGFVGTGLGGGDKKITITDVVEEGKNVKIYYTQEFQMGMNQINEKKEYCAVILPSDNALGYQLQSVQAIQPETVLPVPEEQPEVVTPVPEEQPEVVPSIPEEQPEVVPSVPEEPQGISKFFDDVQLREVARQLRVPDDLQVEFVQREEYWEGAGRYLIHVEVIHAGTVVAYASADPETASVMRGIMSYNGQ